MDNKVFGNLMASGPTGERRWVVWLLVAAAHVLVIGAIVMIPIWSRNDEEVIEIFHEPILLEDVLPAVKPLPPPPVKPAEPGSGNAEPVRSGTR